MEESQLVVQSFSREIQWIDGMPVPVNTPLLSDRGIKEIVPTALSLPYVGQKVFHRDDNGNETITLEIEPQFEGMTNAEVMILKEVQSAAAGNSEATHRLLDRVLGKPKQQNENLNVNASYSEFLDSCTKEQSAPIQHIQTNTAPVTNWAEEFNFDDI